MCAVKSKGEFCGLIIHEDFTSSKLLHATSLRNKLTKYITKQYKTFDLLNYDTVIFFFIQMQES